MADPIQPTLQAAAKPELRDLLSAFGLEMRKQVNCARIGNIQSFNAANQTATVKIAQQQVTSVSPTGVQTLAEYPVLVSVPVFILGGGGLSATFPIAGGDECLIVFNDREIDNWLLAGGTETVPTTQRIHDLSDGMCFVGFRSYPRSLAGYSTTSAQLRTDNGSTYVEVANSGAVNVVSPVGITLDAPNVGITGTLIVYNANGDPIPFFLIGGDFRLVGGGNVVATDVLTNGGVSLGTHVHSGVTTGGGNTGGPV